MSRKQQVWEPDSNVTDTPEFKAWSLIIDARIELVTMIDVLPDDDRRFDKLHSMLQDATAWLEWDDEEEIDVDGKQIAR